MNHISSANHTNFDINADDNDFADLDFSGLDRLAGYEAANEDEGEQMLRNGRKVAEGEFRRASSMYWRRCLRGVLKTLVWRIHEQIQNPPL